MKTTAKEVAQWMKQQIEEFGELYQEDAADQIETQFGTEFVYQNENGSTAIDREVLKEFRTITNESFVWEKRSKLWRRRDPFDDEGRSQ